MNEKLSVSVIITTYKRFDRLKKCIESVLAQTYRPTRIIVVHDGPSTEFDNFHCSVLSNEVEIVCKNTPDWNGRPAPGRNFGLQFVQDDLVAFCDDDDIWFPEKLERQVKFISDDVDCVFSGYIPLYEGDKLPNISTNESGGNIVAAINLIDFLNGNGLCLSSSLIKSSIVRDHKFNETAFVRAFEDYVLWLDLLLNNVRIINLNASLLFYLSNNSSSIRKGKFQHNLRLSLTIFFMLFINKRFSLAIMSPFIRLKYLIFKK